MFAGGFRMKNKVAVILIFASPGLFSSQAMAAGEFTGQWTGEEKDQSTMTLQLKQNDNTITGSYCYITQNGNRIDCPDEGENNLKGTISNHRASVEFASSFGGTGYANLEVEGEKLVWNKAPSSGQGKYYAPQHYTLTKKPLPPSSASPLSKADFSVHLDNVTVSLGQPWEPQIISALGNALGDDFAGEVPFDDENYKFYRHTYSGFDIYSANLWWDKADKSVDDYIVAQITLNSPHYTTRRGIHVGSAADEIEQLYGPTKKERSEDEEWLSYVLAKRVISFELVNDKVASVIMTYDNGQ